MDELEQTLREDLAFTQLFDVQGPEILSAVRLSGDRAEDLEQYRAYGNEVALPDGVQAEWGRTDPRGTRLRPGERPVHSRQAVQRRHRPGAAYRARPLRRDRSLLHRSPRHRDDLDRLCLGPRRRGEQGNLPDGLRRSRPAPDHRPHLDESLAGLGRRRQRTGLSLVLPGASRRLLGRPHDRPQDGGRLRGAARVLAQRLFGRRKRFSSPARSGAAGRAAPRSSPSSATAASPGRSPVRAARTRIPSVHPTAAGSPLPPAAPGPRRST